MTGLFGLLTQLVATFPAVGEETAAPEGGLRVTGLQVELPVEARIDEGGELFASAPRGRMATGFMLPHGRIVARFGVGEEGR